MARDKDLHDDDSIKPGSGNGQESTGAYPDQEDKTTPSGGNGQSQEDR